MIFSVNIDVGKKLPMVANQLYPDMKNYVFNKYNIIFKQGYKNTLSLVMINWLTIGYQAKFRKGE